MLISDQSYLNWQKNLSAKRWYRRFWVGLAIYSVVLLFAMGVYLFWVGRWKILLLVLAAFFLARMIVSPIVFLLYKKPRPYQRLNFKTVYSWLMSRFTIKKNAFPSDHAISFAAIAAVLYFYWPLGFAMVVVLTILNAMARIILGYHDSVDIVGGWILGIVCGLLTVFFLVPLVFTKAG